VDRGARQDPEATRSAVKALRILPEAEEELAEAAAWYEEKRTGLGVELIAVVDRAFEEIADAPLACGLWRHERPYRRKVLARFPYVIFFRLDGDAVVVVAVAHAKRRPGYWADRTRRGAP
jgi:plasmid stabilization system protein ParE